MKVLYISNLFPDKEEFNRGLFNARFTRYFSKHCEIKVLSPRPSFRFLKKFFPREEESNLKPEFHSVPYVPFLGTLWNHKLMHAFLKRRVKEIYDEFKFDIILASWIYPDGCAACRFAKKYRVPSAVTALGTDIHQYAFFPLRRKIILKELESADIVITVSKSLSKILEDAGFSRNKLRVIYYGVEQDIFKPSDKKEIRKELTLPIEEKIVLFVGNLLPIKDPMLTLDSFCRLIKHMNTNNARLIIIGSGPLEGKMKSRVKNYGIEHKVLFAGRKTPSETAKFMQASDVLCLTSHNEGVPNVILESLSCGTPVVTTRVGGIPEVLPEDIPSISVDSRSPEIIARAIFDILHTEFDKNILIRHAAKFSWEHTALEYYKALSEIIRNG